MTSKTNKYFTEMLKKATEFESARAARRVEKEALIREGDWDGMKEWNEREKSFKFPFTHGQRCAFRAWDKSTERNSSIFEVEELPWESEQEAHEFIECLKEAGVTEFAVTDESTALMRTLHTLVDNEGCKMKGLCKVTRKEDRYGVHEAYECDAILMKI